MKKRLTQWTSAPDAREAHPREEHLLPLMVCAGAAGSDRGSASFSDRIMGAKVMAVWGIWGGRQGGGGGGRREMLNLTCVE